MGLISRVSSRTYRKQETDQKHTKKWPFPKSPSPECQRASPRSDLDSPSRLPLRPRPRLLPRRTRLPSDERSSPRPESTPPSTPPRPRLLLTTPRPPETTVTTSCQMSPNLLWSSESEVSTSSRQSRRRPSSSSDSDRSETPFLS